MKTTLVIFLLMIGTAWGQKKIHVQVSGNIFNTKGDSIFISQFFGTHYIDYIKGKIDKKGNYNLSGTLNNPDYYVLRLGNQHINLILRDSSDIHLNADGKNINAFKNISGSDETIALDEFINQMQLFNSKRDSAYNALKTSPEKEQEINKYYQNEYFKFSSYKQRFIGQNPNSPALLPVVATLDPDKEFTVYESVINQLSAGFPESPSVKNAIVQFQQVKAGHDKQQFLEPGKEAPDFTQNDVNGNPITLSDLRGKVVLIDFWASWCGPCRKENPNVVALYNKYKDAGFTILSVSLDKDANLWKAAIAKDGLSWPNHVSDLKSWSNDVARLYQVSSIPFTVLVDREGKIIDTKLRGATLERALSTIFGF